MILFKNYIVRLWWVRTGGGEIGNKAKKLGMEERFIDWLFLLSFLSFLLSSLVLLKNVKTWLLLFNQLNGLIRALPVGCDWLMLETLCCGWLAKTITKMYSFLLLTDAWVYTWV